MTEFQNILWGYELTIPYSWVHQTSQGVEVFAGFQEAFDPGYDGPSAGYLMIKSEWNCARTPIEPLWNEQIGKLAGMMGAHKVGSAIWHMAGASGMEAEIDLPKRSNQRLWTGILSHNLSVHHFMVVHPKEQRRQFEPIATQIISSLRFVTSFQEHLSNDEGIPLPKGYGPFDPTLIISNINNPQDWRGYDGESEIGALQAFYLREAPAFGWEILEYVPFPCASELGFARLILRKDQRLATLGLMPVGDQIITASSLAKVVVKFE